MINQDKWISTLSKTNARFSKTTINLDHDRWVNTIPKKRWVNTIPKKTRYNSVKKYSLMTILFVCGLLFVSVVKNETRNLQRIINNLEASINVIKYNLDQAILDNEVITSPENISLLAKEYLNQGLVSYKKSQIKKLNETTENFAMANTIKKEKNNAKKIKNLPANVKSQIVKKIEETKTEIRKLQALYHNPKSIPAEVKTKVAKQIEEKKFELKNLYNSPKDGISLHKIGSWSVIQVVKAFLGMPIIPGR